MKRLGILILICLLFTGCKTLRHKDPDLIVKTTEELAAKALEHELEQLLYPGRVVTPLDNLSPEELMSLAEETKAKIATYPKNTSPATTEYLLGMDGDPDATWAVNIFPFSSIIDLTTASYGPGTTGSPSSIYYDSDAAGADDADEEAAKIAVNMATVTEDAEDGVMELQVMLNGTETTYQEIDGVNDRIEFKKSVDMETNAFDCDNNTVTLSTLLGIINAGGATSLEIPNSNADPSVLGQIRVDITVTNYTDGALRWYDGNNIRHVVDMVAATAEACTDDQVVAYDADIDRWYCKADAGAGTVETIETDGTPSSSGTYEGFIISGVNAGEAVTAGDIVYMDGTSNEWMLADANVAGEFPAIGMSAEDGTDGNPMLVLIRGVARLDSWSWTNEGVKLYLSETPGGMTETTPSDDGDCVQILATVLAITTDTILFNADSTWFLDDGS